MTSAPASNSPERSRTRFIATALLVLAIASALVSCGDGADEAAYDADGQLICPALPEAAESLPQIYVLDLERPEVLAQAYGIDDVVALSVIRRDVVERSPVHFGWHRGGAVAPVRMWSTVGGIDASRSLPPIAIDGLATTDDPCELQRFDALAGFYDYIAIEGTGEQARRFDVVGASDAFLTEFLGQPQAVEFDQAAVNALIDDFGDDRSLFTNRRYVLIAAAALATLVALWWLSSASRRVRKRTEATPASPPPPTFPPPPPLSS